MNDTKPSICIVSHNAYGVLANIDTGHAGGIEVQTPLMARWLAKNGFATSMITWDEGYSDGENIDGVSVYKLCKQQDGIPIIRFLTPRWTSLISALNRANADIIYYNCGDLGLGQVTAWAKQKKRKVVYSIASDIDCIKTLPAIKNIRERLLYKYGLFRADIIIVQTQRQKFLLKNEFGLESTLARMPSAGFPLKTTQIEKTTCKKKLRVLWVGRITTEKRIEWLLDVAEKMPHIHFDILGDTNRPTAYADQQIERAAKLGNITSHGRVPHQEMGAYYANADLLCSTSIYEGFPNVYLEAWSIGLPLVTTYDPDNVIATFKHGRIASSVSELAAAITELSSYENRKKASAAALKYFKKFHTINSSMPVYEKIFSSIT